MPTLRQALDHLEDCICGRKRPVNAMESELVTMAEDMDSTQMKELKMALLTSSAARRVAKEILKQRGISREDLRILD